MYDLAFVYLCRLFINNRITFKQYSFVLHILLEHYRKDFNMSRRKISAASSKNEFIRSATKIDAKNLPRQHRRGGTML